MFPANNPWNQRVDRLPVARDSAALVARIGLGDPVHADFGSGLYDGAPIGIPYAIVSKHTRRVPVSFDYASRVRRAPLSARPPRRDRGRRELDRRSPRDRRRPGRRARDYELFAAYPHDGGTRWTAGSGAIFNLRSNHLRPAAWTLGRRRRAADPPRARPLRRGRRAARSTTRCGSPRRARPRVRVPRPPLGRHAAAARRCRRWGSAIRLKREREHLAACPTRRASSPGRSSATG